MGYFSNAVSVTASYLPAQVTETLNQVSRLHSTSLNGLYYTSLLCCQTRAFATVTVPRAHADSGLTGVFPNQVAVGVVAKKTRVLLATSDGYLYIYDLPGKNLSFFVLITILAPQAPKVASAFWSSSTV